MLATAVTLAILGFAVRALADLAKQDGAKVVDALWGRSWAAAPKPDRPILARLSSTRTVAVPDWRPELSAAA